MRATARQPSVASWSLCVSVMAFGLLPRWCGGRMFVDGVTYATIARNWAETSPVSFWHLHYTDSVHSNFVEHPPLAIWLLGAVFAVVGDVPWAETLGSALVTAAYVVALRSLWHAATLDTSSAAPFCLLVFLCPLTSWVLANNMLEGPLAIFCMVATTCLLRAPPQSLGIAFGYGMLAGVATAAALLCKGVVALFVLGLPMGLWATRPLQRATTLWASLGLWTSLGVIAAGLSLQTDARAYLGAYVHQQIYRSIAGHREIGAWRGVAVVRLVAELCAPSLALVMLSRATRGKAEAVFGLRPRAQAVFWMVYALTASVPIAVSPKQSSWYAFAALPFGCLSLALQGACPLQRASAALHPARRSVWGAATFGGALAVAMAASRAWHAKSLHDEFHFVSQCAGPTQPTVVHAASNATQTNWKLQALLARHRRISVADDPSALWHLVDKRDPPNTTDGARCGEETTNSSGYAWRLCRL